jgi:feruloyl esterase
MAATLKDGYATAGSDTGHTGDSRYALDHPEKVIDFSYRAAHEVSEKSKAIITQFYGNPTRLSFMDGCGGGAFTAQNAMQRFPGDFNGIAITGFSHKTRHALWQQWVWDATHKDAASNLPNDKLALLNKAALDTCDALDGVRNREIENPMVCKFDPGVLQCRGGDTASCLTPAQVEAARKIYAGPRNPRTGEAIYFPPMPGSEIAWSSMTGAQPFGFATDFFKYFVFNDPNWDSRTRPFNFDSDVALAENPKALLTNANNPDIRAFLDRGGKLLLYEGWNDHFTLPGIAIDYYNKVVQAVGPARARDSVRLFMMPGLNHCEDRGEFDMVKELEKWIQTNTAPDRIVGSRVWDGKVAGTRLLCSYPQVATYNGSGNTDDAANYTCKMP